MGEMAMDIHRSIEILEAADFYLYRRVVNGSELISAQLVYPAADLYVEVDSLIDGILLRFSGLTGNHTHHCPDTGSLRNAIQRQVQSAKAAWDAEGLPPAFPDLERWLEGLELQLVQRLNQTNAEHGYCIECIWLAADFSLKCLYRGAVIRVNEELMTAIGVDGKRVAIPLNIALALLDEMGGMEEQQIEEPEALAS